MQARYQHQKNIFRPIISRVEIEVREREGKVLAMGDGKPAGSQAAGQQEGSSSEGKLP